MNKLILTTILLTAGLLLGNTQYGMAFKGMGAAGDTNSAAVNKTGQHSIIIEGHEGSREIIVARVNGAPVTMGALVDSIRETMMVKYGKTKVTEDIARSLRNDAFERLVLEELACQRAVDLGISIDPEIIKKTIAARRDAAGGEEAFQTVLSQQNTTLQAFERQTERFFLIKELIYQDIEAKIDVSEESLNKAYEANKEQFVQQERVKISDIVFFLDPEDPAAEQRVLDIRAKIINELSGNPAELKEKGMFVKSNLNITADFKPILYKYSMELKPGEFSDPLLIDGTLHLVKLESYHPRKEKPEEEVKAYLSSQITTSQKTQRLPLWRRDLLKNGKVEIIHDILK